MPQPPRYVRYLLSEDDFDLLQSLAELDGHSLNDFARSVMRRWLRSVRNGVKPDQNYLDFDAAASVARHIDPGQRLPVTPLDTRYTGIPNTPEQS